MSKLRMALIGGGGQAFIGRVHAWAAQLDQRAELVAGALSSDPEKARQSAASFGIRDERAYGSVTELLRHESQLPADRRVHFVSIATPNHTHYSIAKEALEQGFHVFCDKPMTLTLEEASSLQATVAATQRQFVLTHNYSGYPMVRQARAMVAAGEVGEVIAVRAQYVQGWVFGLDLTQTPPRGAWKEDPQKSGSGALGDIGTHAFHLLRYVTQLEPAQLSCRLRTFRTGRQVDDCGLVSLTCRSGALASIAFSQVSHGRLNDLQIEVDGTKGSLAWRQEEPNQLVVRRTGQPTLTYDRMPGGDLLHEEARSAARIPGGHPEAFLEAFANVYNAGFAAIEAGEPPAIESGYRYPTVGDGVEGVRFIEACLRSDRDQATWLTWEEVT